jgi:CHAT domain-containing protein
VVSSYTPTLTALLRARLSQPSLPVERIQVVTITAEHAQDSNMIPLLYVREETQSIIEIVGRAGAAIKSDSSTSTKADVLTLFETANVVHLACHGVQHPTEPHKSRFCLTMGDLSVSELMDMDLKNAFVAFLSACETAKGNEQHADEVVHLAAAMLLSGFKSVVATMWWVRR